jgi:hypothetical protein
MVALVYITLIGVAAATIGMVFWYVLREEHAHYEHYIPQPDHEQTDMIVSEAKPAEESAAS